MQEEDIAMSIYKRTKGGGGNTKNGIVKAGSGKKNTERGGMRTVQVYGRRMGRKEAGEKAGI